MKKYIDERRTPHDPLLMWSWTDKLSLLNISKRLIKSGPYAEAGANMVGGNNVVPTKWRGGKLRSVSAKARPALIERLKLVRNVLHL